MKKKVLLVGLTNGVGGVETFLVNIIKNIDINKFDIECLVHQDVNEKYQDDLKNIKINRIVGIKKNPFKFLKEIISFYKNNNFDVVHLNQCTSLFFVYVFPILFDKKVKFIVHSHNGNGNNKLLHKLLSFIQNRRADVKIACSDVAGKWMFGKGEYVIVENGIDLKKYQYKPEDVTYLKKELNLYNNKKIIGSVARFDKQKNHKKIIKIYKEYFKINSNSVLILVGDGEEKDNVIHLIDEYELNENVILLGVRNDVHNILKLFDVLLIPSLYEGLPFIMIEAQAASLPILASETISNQIEITDLVYRENLETSDEIWAKKIDFIIENNKTKRLEKDYGCIIKNKGFDISDTVKKISEYYN